MRSATRALAKAASAPRFHLEEATIADVHRAIRAKEITAEQLVQLYFKRIEAYNGTCVKGEVDPATGLMFGEITPVENAGQVNAYMTLNIRGKRSKTDRADNDPKMMDALETARAQDAYFARTGNFVGPLHGIPIAVKDNFDTVDMRTTAGAAADYANDKPPKDATMVAKLRAAGAIILGKTNLDEYAPAGIGRSTLGGQTCNPYDTKRITGGSSAGTAAAVAANLAICGLGTDTSGSVRYPSSLNALVGIVATQGLVSRAGIVPLTFSRDRGGPMCRTVEDTAAVLEVLTGDDPRDAITAVAHGRQPVAYSKFYRPPFARRQAAWRRARLHDRGHHRRPRKYPYRQRGARRHEESWRDACRSGRFQRRHCRDHDRVRAEFLYPDLPGRTPRRRKADRPSGGNRQQSEECCPAARAGSICACSRPAIRALKRDTRSISISRSVATRSFAAWTIFMQPSLSPGRTTGCDLRSAPRAERLDTPDAINHTLRIANLQRILYKVMADNNLDALVYVYTTIPAPLVYPSRVAAVYNARLEPRILKAGTKMSDPDLVPGEPSLKTDLDTFRSAGGSFAVNLSPVSGFPAIVVPAGFTRVIYDRVPDASDPNGSRLEGPKPDQVPVAMEFLGRPFDEALLFEIASAYEAGTTAPPGAEGIWPARGEP